MKDRTGMTTRRNVVIKDLMDDYEFYQIGYRTNLTLGNKESNLHLQSQTQRLEQ
jgi:hypothetical protein